MFIKKCRKGGRVVAAAIIFYEVITFTLLHVKLNDISNLVSLTGIPLPFAARK
jgi:hypothetical protein